MSDHPLGRRPPTDFVHVERYPLTATTTPANPVPCAIGVNWYRQAFDNPIRDRQGRWWIGRGPLGPWSGEGHCVCLVPETLDDLPAWRDFYDQGREGACVGFGSSRMMSLLNRKRYDARWLWNRAKEVDEWADTNPGDDNGTSVRAAMDVLRREGHKPWTPTAAVKPAEGIAANRWARTVDDVLGALGSPVAYEKLGAVPFANSWGRAYPMRTWMPLEVLQRLLDEDGEATVVTDR